MRCGLPAMAAGRLLLALYAAFHLLQGGVCQGPVVEQPLSCFQSSADCTGNETSLTYSDCCAGGTELFTINGTCYMCSDLLSFTASAYEVREGAKYVSLGVQRRVNPGTNNFFFNSVINDGTALAGIDYGQFPDSGVGFINIVLEGESQVGAGIVIIDDDIVEYNENFTVSLQPLSRSFQPLGGFQGTALVTIIDDDKVDITLEPPGPLTANESSSLVFFLNKTGQAQRAVQVQINLTDPELQFGDGGPPDIRTFTFEPRDPPKRIEIVVVDDDIVEATEDHVIRLVVPEGETGVNLPRDSNTISVQDDGDTVTLSLETATFTVQETQGGIMVALQKTGANQRPVFVRVFTEPITAQAGDDFSAIDRVFEVPSEGNEFMININVSSDGRVEDMEMFRLTLEVPGTENGVTLGIDAATFSIIDTDFLTVDVSATSLAVAEGESVSFRVSGSGATLQRSVLISVTPTSGGDVVISPQTVGLSEDQLEATVTVNGSIDDLYEGAESLQLMITSSDSAVRFSSPSPAIAVEIADNNSPQLTFSEEVYKFNETQGMAEISISFRARTEISHSWTLTSVPLTATEGVDYIIMPINQVLTFSNTVRSESVSFRIVDDGLSEGIESFRLELRDSDGELTTSSVVQILDDEKLEISFTNRSSTVSENDGFFYLPIVKSGVTTSDITIELNITDGSATGGVDYGFFPTPVFPAITLILADETSIRFPIPIKNDDIIERTESFNVALVIRGNDGTIVPGDIRTTVVSIEDDDKLRVFLEGGGEVEEGGSDAERTLQFTISRDENATLTRDIVVSFSTSDDSATAGTRDYVPSGRMLTFSPNGVLSFTETVLVLDDTTVEARERFFVALSPSFGETALVLPENATAVNIIDDDNIQVDFVDAAYTFSEGAGVATVLLRKTGDNEIPVMVSVVTETQDDTAIAGKDYNATIEPVEFQSSQDQVPINIPLLDDDIVENLESFTVVLSVAGTSRNVELGLNDTAKVTILDDDTVSVRFSQTGYTGREGEEVSVTVELTGEIERSVEVEIVSRVDSTDVNDFSPQSGAVVFSPGEVRKDFLVSLTQDTMCDDRIESFSLFLESGGSSVAVGQPASTTVFIVDDDECILQFLNDTRVEVMEGETDSQITLCVGIGGNLVLDRDIRFAPVAEVLTDIPVQEQALPGVDFMLEPTVETLRPADSMSCFNVTILMDDRVEGVKMFNISVFAEDEDLQSSRAEVMVVIGAQNDTEPPTTDPQPAVEFSADLYSVMESDGVAEITLTISPPPSDPAFLRAVFLNTADGTATAPGDYTAQVNTSVTIEGTSATVLVEIVADDVTEGEESFSVFLLLPEMIVPRVRLGDRSRATVIIGDPADVFVDDTVTGDPFFIVPLSLAPNSSSFDESPSLCFEIHGVSGSTFNLVSDTCTSVNALYRISSVNSDLNFISEIGVKAVDLNSDCVDIRIAVDRNCTPEIRRGNDDVTTLPRFENAGVLVRQSGSSVRISVPNCANSQLVMWVKCREVNSQPQLRFDITRGFNLQPTSHGLLGQFWNIPIRVTRYVFTGAVVYDLQSQELYRVDILSPDGSDVVRQFVAEFNPRTWDHDRPEPCLYAGDQQGGRTLEISTFNDPVIENNYRLYRTGGLFATGFRFSKFEASRCRG